MMLARPLTWTGAGRLVVVPAKAYGHDLEGMLAAITPNTRIIFVANPDSSNKYTVDDNNIVFLD